MAGRTTSMLLLVAAAAVVLLADFQAVEARRINLCIQTAYPSLCQPLVGRMISPRRATHITIKALEAKTKVAITNAAKYKAGNQAISICYSSFSDALYNLQMARKSIRKRDTLSLNIHLSAVVSDYGACVDAFIESRQINFIQNESDVLRKMSSNCLSLSTLIR